MVIRSSEGACYVLSSPASIGGTGDEGMRRQKYGVMIVAGMLLVSMIDGDGYR